MRPTADTVAFADNWDPAPSALHPGMLRTPGAWGSALRSLTAPASASEITVGVGCSRYGDIGDDQGRGVVAAHEGAR